MHGNYQLQALYFPLRNISFGVFCKEISSYEQATNLDNNMVWLAI